MPVLEPYNAHNTAEKQGKKEPTPWGNSYHYFGIFLLIVVLLTAPYVFTCFWKLNPELYLYMPDKNTTLYYNTDLFIASLNTFTVVDVQICVYIYTYIFF